MKDENFDGDIEKTFNFQYPKKKELKEEYEIVLITENFLILKNRDGNNVRVKCSNTSVYSLNEKIYKENGVFSWEKL